jgi:2'-hydroxyisoflavone reductase
MKLTRRDILLGALASLSLAACGGAATAPAPPPSAPPLPRPPEAAPKKKILILGGTNFLGPQLVEVAKARGHTLTLFNRGKTNPQLFPDIEKLRGDRKESLKALEGRKWDAVIDTSGFVPRIVKASATLLAPNVGQYVFISSISAIKDTSKLGIDESSPVATMADPASEDVPKDYGALKALCEQAAEAAMPGRVTNIRPGFIVGPGDNSDRFTYWPVRIEKGGEVLTPGDGKDPVQFVDVRDLAAWIILLIEQRGMGIFNATGPAEKLLTAAFLEACKAVSASSAAFTWVSGDFLDKQSVELPIWAPASGETLGFHQINCQKAIRSGLRFRPMEETIRDTLAWWKTLPDARRAKPRAGLSAEREIELLAEWKKRGSSQAPKAKSTAATPAAP